MRNTEDLIHDPDYKVHNDYFDKRATYIPAWPNLGFWAMKPNGIIYVLALFRPQHKDHWSICRPLMFKIAECERDHRIVKGYVNLYNGERGRYKDDDCEFVARQTMCHVEDELKDKPAENGTTFSNGKVALPYNYLTEDFKYTSAYRRDNDERF